MIDKDRLSKVTDVYFHASCPDGTSSAMIIADAFAEMEQKVSMKPIHYGSKEHTGIVPKPGQLFVDITPPLDRWRDWLGTGVIVLDHHETAKDATEGLDGVYATNAAHSGAVLAYENVLVPLLGGSDRWGQFAGLAMIRDTWKKNHPLWPESCAQAEAMTLFGAEALVTQVTDGSFDEKHLMTVGRMLVKSLNRRAKHAASLAIQTGVGQGAGLFRIAAFNCTEKLVSDAANVLVDDGVDVAVGYSYLHEDGQTKAIVSVRTGGRASARLIAEMNGGGGHDRAAGFRICPGEGVSPADVLEVVKRSVIATEASRPAV